MVKQEIEMLPLDTSDVDRWVGKPLGGLQLKEPMTVNDIRRWAQGMQNPNPLYYDEKFARDSVFKEITGPQSFTVCCTAAHGATPAIQGNIPGSHMLFGGDEWWFFGPRIRPGDRMHSDRMCVDYRVSNTKFAGPTVFTRGDTTYINQRGEVVAKQRSTSIRYLVENARRLDSMRDQEEEPEWTDEQLAKLEQDKLSYYKTFQRHVLRRFQDVGLEETLPTGIIGPHSIRSFTTEWRSFTWSVWGSTFKDSLASTEDAGWLPQMSARAQEEAQVDPHLGDGLDYGASRGHVNPQYARLIGMPRAYGYGATMGGWVLDYVGNWTGELGIITHSDARYRSPALVGDVTYLNGRVTEKRDDPVTGEGLVTVRVEMTTQEGTQMAIATVEVRLPKS